MATRPSTIDFIVEQIAGAGVIRSHKMFGEYALYCDDRVVGFVCDDQLFVKITPEGKSFASGVGEGQPYPAAKPYLLVPGDKWEDPAWLTKLIRITADAVPPQSAKPARRESAKRAR